MKHPTSQWTFALVLLALCIPAAHADLVLQYSYDAVAANTTHIADDSGHGALGIRSGGGNWTPEVDPTRGAVLNNTTSIAITRQTVNYTAAPTNEATIAGWYKGTDNGYFFDQGEDRFIAGYGTNTSGKLAVWHGSWILSAMDAPDDGEWHHLAYVYGNDGTDATATIYVDGVAATWAAGGTTITMTGQGMVNLTSTSPTAPYQRLFSDNNGVSTSRLVGLVDDTRIYNEALSSAEVNALIPEPATMSLLALGGIAMLRRRKKA